MMLKSPIIVLLIVLINLLNLVELKAQTGPGGIEDTGGSSDLTVWLDANKLSNSDGTNVSSWTDQSGYSNTASAPSGNEPVFHTNVLNSHPIIRFTAANNDYFRISDDASLKPAKISIFVVGSYTSNSGNGDGWGPFVIKTDNYHWTNGYGLARWDKNEKIAFFVNKYNSNFISSSMSYNTSTIMSAVYDKSNVELFYNETSQGTDAYSSDISNSTNYLYVGVSSDDAGSGTKSPLDGDIAEVIILKREVNKAERIIIDNYLSAKYSINISNDYYSYQATHSNDLVGIGRVDASNTHTASMSAGILQIENPSTMTSNNEFLLFAHDNGSISSWTTTEAPSIGNIERIAREWRLDETGDVGTVDFKISVTDLPSFNTGYSKYGLMVDADGDFSSGATVYELTSSGSYYVASGISIDDGDFVSIAAIKPAIQFDKTTSKGGEASNASVDVVLNYITASTMSVDYATSNGSAVSGSDYTSASGTVSITAGNVSNSISVTITDDSDVESNEDFDIDLSSPSSGLVLGTSTTHTYTIEDNDNTRKINFDNATANGSESTTSVNVGLTITSADASNDTKVDYTVIGGTASGGGTDYTLANGTVTISAGTATTGSFSISINNDALDEDDETIIIELSNPVNCNLGATKTHTYTINDDDPTPTIQFHSASSNGDESVANKVIQIDLSAASSKDVSVSISTSGTATEGDDYTKSATSITIAAGSTSANLTLSITDDALDEDNETAIMTISGPTNATLGTNTSHTYTINDDDPTPTIQFHSASSSGDESVASKVIQIDLSAASGKDVSVNIGVSGTATETDDYTKSAASITIPAGSTSANLTLSITDDALDEDNETAIMTISGPTNATLGTNTSHTYTINDNDATPTIEFNTTSSDGDESVATKNLQIDLSAVSGRDVTVNVATSGTATENTDYTISNSTITITAGNTSTNLTLSITDDGDTESDETAKMTISGPTNATLGTNTSHTYTIKDNDNSRKIDFDVATANNNESTTSVNVGLTITSADASNDTKVDYTVTGGTASGSGTDYTLADGTVTIAAGTSTTGSFTISINNDALDEDNETIIIELSNPVNCNLGTTTTYTYTINDDDATPTIQFNSTSSSGAESVATKNLQIDLSAASGKDVSVNVATSGTADEGSDYSISNSTITITAGNTSANLTLSITDDDYNEDNETAIMTISGPTNASLGTNTSHTYTINDNDDYDGPNGVSSRIRLWVKADAGVTSSSGNISQWDDQTGAGHNATQGNASYQPSISSVRTNYQPGIYFDGGNENLSLSDLIPSDNRKLTIIAFGSNETGGDQWHTMVLGQGNGSWNGGGYGLSTQNTANTTFGFWVNNYSANVVKTTWSNKPEEILIGVYNGSNLYYYMNAKSIGTDSYSGTVGDNGGTHIGSSNNGTDFNHKGYINEVIIYSDALSSSDLKQVNSYLAIKYGVTLDRTTMSSNYYNSSNTSIFTDGGTYWNDIIAIGRDDDGPINQKQSKQADDSTKIYISTLETSNSSNSGSFSSDNQFVVIGSNDGQLCATDDSQAEEPTGIESRLEREWKVQNTGFSGTFSIDITLNSKADVDHVNTADLRLLVDDDGDFTDASIYAAGGGLSFSYSKPIVTISGISTTQIASNSTKYITLASTDSVNTPLPVELLSFNAERKNNTIVLNWTTATEENNDYFTIEKSSNGIDFNVLNNISGAGNSNDITKYSDIDYFPFDGINYYRLKQTDFDGKYSYSNIVSVDYSMGNSGIKIIPNPATDNITVKGLESELSEIHIFNIVGNDLSSEVYLKRESDNIIRIDLSKLSRGIYFIKTKSSITKFTKL